MKEKIMNEKNLENNTSDEAQNSSENLLEKSMDNNNFTFFIFDHIK